LLLPEASEAIRDCYQHRIGLRNSPSPAVFCRWLRLARSYELAERLAKFPNPPPPNT